MSIKDLWLDLVGWFEQIDWLNVLLIIGKLALLTIIVIVVHFVVRKLLKKLLKIKIRIKSVNNDKLERRNETLNQLIVSVLRYITIPIYVVLALPILGVNPTTVFAGAGIVGLVVTFAFQDLLKDIVAGLGMNAITLLTHSKEITYKDYIEQIVSSKNLYAIIVKRADMKDHLMQTETLTDKLREKYFPVLGMLM